MHIHQQIMKLIETNIGVCYFHSVLKISFWIFLTIEREIYDIGFYKLIFKRKAKEQKYV